MNLQELLGEELFSQVTEKLGDNKIAIVSDGSFIPKEKFDAVNTEKNEYKKQLTDRDQQLEELKGKAKDSEELQQVIKDLQQQNENAQKEYQDKLTKQAFDFKLDRALSEAKAKNPRAVKALLDLENIKLDGDKLLGFEEQLKGLQESDAYLFDDGEPAGLKGRTPHPSNPSNTGGNAITKEQFNSMTYTEKANLFQESPELYNQLKQ